MERMEAKPGLSEAVILTSAEDIAAFLLLMRKAFRTSGQTESEERLVLEEAERDGVSFVEYPDPNEYFIGIKDGNQIVAGGALQIITFRDGRKIARLSGHAVDPRYRGRELAQEVTDKSITIAEEQNCERVEASVNANNPAALITKFHNDFEAYDLSVATDPNDGFFQIRKYLRNSDHSTKDNAKEWKEVAFHNLPLIKQYLDNGWRGIDLKNTAKPTDNDPEKWTLILGKQ